MVQPLPIRQEEPPDDTATDAHEDFGVYAVSVEAALDSPVDEVCRTSPRIGRRYCQIRLSSFGRLRAAGFAVLATFDAPHFDIVLPDVSELTVARLERCFDPPIPNPGRGGGS